MHTVSKHNFRVVSSELRMKPSTDNPSKLAKPDTSGTLVSLVERDPEDGYLSSQSQPTQVTDGRCWQTHQETSLTFQETRHRILISAKALEAGVYHVHTQLNVAASVQDLVQVKQ